MSQNSELYPFFPSKGKNADVDFPFDQTPIEEETLFANSDFVVVLRLSEYKDFHVVNILDHANVDNVYWNHGYTEFSFEVIEIFKSNYQIEKLNLNLLGMTDEVRKMGYVCADFNVDECTEMKLGDTFKFYLRKYGDMFCTTNLGKSVFFADGSPRFK